MMYPQEVRLNEANIQKFLNVLTDAYKEIAGELEGATDFGVANRRAILGQIRGVLESSGADANGIIDKEITRIYKVGATQANEQLKNAGAPAPSTGFNRIHKEAIAALVDDTQRAFGESMTGVNRSAGRILGTAVREQITQKMATGKLGGKALRSIRNTVAGVIKNEGIDALVDKGGRQWTLNRYAEMLIRTKAVEARNRGLANRIVENGYDLVEVSSHGADDACGDWEGEILSVTGDTPGYKTVSDAEAGGLFHPNCKHAINALVPALAEKTNAYDSATGDYEE